MGDHDWRGDLAERCDAAIADIRTRIQGLPRYFTLAELLLRPEILVPPPVVVPRLAWAGRVTLLAADVKLGKSTLVCAAIAAVTRGALFTGQAVTQGPVILVSCEEHPSDPVRRLQGKADPNLVYIVGPGAFQEDRFAELERLVETIRPVLVVLDTLSSFTAGIVRDPFSSAEWNPLMLRIAQWAREWNPAIIVNHHVAKGSGRYRDSSAIGALSDQIIEMGAGDRDTTVRVFKSFGRLGVEDFRLRWEEGRYVLANDALSPEAAVLAWVTANPGKGITAIRDAVGGRHDVVDLALAALERAGAIKDEGQVQGRRTSHRYFPAIVGAGRGRSMGRSILEDDEISNSLRGNAGQVGADDGAGAHLPTPGGSIRTPGAGHHHDGYDGDERTAIESEHVA